MKTSKQLILGVVIALFIASCHHEDLLPPSNPNNPGTTDSVPTNPNDSITICPTYPHDSTIIIQIDSTNIFPNDSL